MNVDKRIPEPIDPLEPPPGAPSPEQIASGLWQETELDAEARQRRAEFFSPVRAAHEVRGIVASILVLVALAIVLGLAVQFVGEVVMRSSSSTPSPSCKPIFPEAPC